MYNFDELCRYDVKEEHLTQFFEWSIEVSVTPESNVFVKYGCLASVAMILKHGKREDLLPHARKLLEWIINAEFKNNSGTNIQKLVYKNIQRIGMCVNLALIKLLITVSIRINLFTYTYRNMEI